MEALSGQLTIILWLVGAAVLYWLYSLTGYSDSPSKRIARYLIWVVAIGWAIYGADGTMDNHMQVLFGCAEDAHGSLVCK